MQSKHSIHRPKPSKYTPEVIAWIVANAGTVPVKDMAVRFNSTIGAFRRFLSALRSNGVAIPKELPRPAHPVGTIVERVRRVGYVRKYQKQEDGTWLELKNPAGKGRPVSNSAGKKNNYVRKPKVKNTPLDVQPVRAPRPSRKTSQIIPKDVEAALEKSKLFVHPSVIPETEKVKILMPGGNFVVCDKDKVDATVRFLLKQNKSLAAEARC